MWSSRPSTLPTHRAEHNADRHPLHQDETPFITSQSGNTNTRLHHITAGLLQLPLPRTPSITPLSPSVGPELCSKAADWIQKAGSYNPHPSIAPLVVLNGLTPPYITELIHHHSAPRSLRLGSLGLLHVPRTRLKQRGDRAFAVAAPPAFGTSCRLQSETLLPSPFLNLGLKHTFSPWPFLPFCDMSFILYVCSMSMYVVCVPLYASLHHVRHFGQ